jgi:transcriptional regulator with XRE-family HTH domain
MEKDVIQRIKEIISVYNINENILSKKIGIAQSTLNGYFNNNRKLSFTTISSILNEFEDISAEWLLRGKGNMYNTENSIPDIKTGDMQSVYETVVRDKDEQIEKMKAEINQLIGENSIMREQLGIASRKISNKSA